MTVRYVTYYRVSTDGQGKSGLGLEAQRAAVLPIIAGGTVVSEFTEIETGKHWNPNRPELDKALHSARIHRATLVVAKLDRLSRNVAFLSRLIETGVELRCADLPAIEGATGRFLLHQMAAVAELEAGMISTRTKAALTAAKARGTKLGGRRYRDGVLVSTPALARSKGAATIQAKANSRATAVGPVIRSIQASGVHTLLGIAERLNQSLVPTARGGAWTAGQVQRVLDRIEG